MNILIITEGSSDLYFFASLLEEYFKYFAPDLKDSINILCDLKRNLYINIENSDKQMKIYLKNAIDPNIKKIIDTYSLYSSIEKMYNFKPRTFSYVYMFYDYDKGSTSSESIKDYLKLIDDGELFPILSYPSFESEIFLSFHDEILNNWENLQNCTVRSVEISSQLFLLNKGFCFKDNNYSIGSHLKLLREDLKKKYKICDSSKCISLKFKSTSDYLEKTLTKSLDKDYSYYIDNQQDIFNTQISFGEHRLLSNFFMAVCKDICTHLTS